LTATTGRQHLPFLRRQLPAALAMLHCPLRELSVALVGDVRMSRLHRQFMGIDGPTDVLTFPLDTDPRGRPAAGEIVICVPVARRESTRHGTKLAHELLLYAVHGLLHLCGYDDRTKSGFEKMHRLEDDILTHLGVGITFARSADGATQRRRRRGKAEP
jgi:probable rRNA maturation factor